MALQSARMAYLEVDPEALEKVALYLDSAASLRGARYGYLPRTGSDEVMTAEGLLCRQYLGWKRDDRRLMSGVEYLSVHPINFQDPNVYYWYYVTQVLHHMDDKHWDRWNERMRVELPKRQEQGGREKRELVSSRGPLGRPGWVTLHDGFEYLHAGGVLPAPADLHRRFWFIIVVSGNPTAGA